MLLMLSVSVTIIITIFIIANSENPFEEHMHNLTSYISHFTASQITIVTHGTCELFDLN